jgi:alkanesulfonate monooxygenase SsuD/methylene tetrahydromethanopterin reductase-like flavin-dependent oxidoreductase (luciferase family)
MDVGLFLATTGPMLSGRDFAAMARAADDRGFHSLWVAEHILFFDQFVSKPPFSERSALVAGEFGLFDPFAALAYVACATRDGSTLTPRPFSRRQRISEGSAR